MIDRNDFLKESINDIQATIRAIDAKFFGTIALFLIPITELEVIAKSLQSIYIQSICIAFTVLAILLICWILGMTCCLFGIYPINLTNKRVERLNYSNAKGLFYQSELFKIDLFKQLRSIEKNLKYDLKNLNKELELSESEIHSELAYEQIKLVFVRDLKMSRQKISIISLYIFLIVTFVVVVLNNFHFNA